MKWYASFPAALSSAYFQAMHELGGDADFLVTCDLVEPLQPAEVIHAFKRLVTAHPVLQSSYSRRRSTSAASDDWQGPLDTFCMALGRTGNLASCPPALAQRFPLRLSHVEASRLVFVIDHHFSDGRTALRWIELFFQQLNGADRGSEAVEASFGKAGEGTPGQGRDAFRRLLRLSGSNLRTWRAWTRACDDIRAPLLADGPRPTLRYASSRFVWPAERVNGSILSRALPGEKFAQTFTRLLAAHILERAGALPGLGVEVIKDLRASLGISPLATGNHGGSLMAYIDRSQPIDAQLRPFFDAVRSGASLAMALMFGALAPWQGLRVRRMKGELKKSLDRRGAFMCDNLLTISSVGVVGHPATRRHVKAISLRAHTHSVYVSATTINESTAFEICYPSTLFQASKVADWVESYFS